MDPRIANELQQKEPTAFHKSMLAHCKTLVEMSRTVMAEHYDDWDEQDRIFRHSMDEDESDKKAKVRKEPIRMVVPLTSAQISTFIAFCMSLFYQRERLFTLSGRGEEDHVSAKVGEALIDRDLEWNDFHTKLYQHLLDVSRFGIGVFKIGWTERHAKVRVNTEKPGLRVFGLDIIKPDVVSEVVDQIEYQGNVITNVSPYCFFPDPRIPLNRMQEGEFCADECEYPLITLQRLESDGEIAGVEFVKTLSSDSMTARTNRRRFGDESTDTNQAANIMSGANSTSGTYVLTECQVSIVPNSFKLEDGTTLGEENYPVKYVVWYINDERVVKCEPLNYLHGQFTYTVAEYSPDDHRLVNDGLSAAIQSLQEVISWLINSHITAVRKTIQNWLVVDPAGVQMEDIHARKSLIRLKPEASRNGGIDRYVKQLGVVDVTQNHISDAKVLIDIAQLSTGLSEAVLGSFAPRRTSAQEARQVGAAAATRIKVVATLIWFSSLLKLGQQMISNLRDGLDHQTYVKVMGLTADPAAFQVFKDVTRTSLVGNYDFEVFDGTLPSERLAHASALSELLQAVLSNPAAGQMLGYDPQKLMTEILELRGIKNPNRFKIPGYNSAAAMTAAVSPQPIPTNEPSI